MKFIFAAVLLVLFCTIFISADVKPHPCPVVVCPPGPVAAKLNIKLQKSELIQQRRLCIVCPIE